MHYRGIRASLFESTEYRWTPDVVKLNLICELNKQYSLVLFKRCVINVHCKQLLNWAVYEWHRTEAYGKKTYFINLSLGNKI